MRKKRFLLRLSLSVLWIALIFWRSSRSAEQSDAESIGLLYYIRMVLPWMTNKLLRKLAHGAEFGVLGMLLSETFRHAGRSALLPPIAFGLLTALCDETIQLYVPGRSGSVRDLWIDLSGVVLGTVLIFAVRRIRNRNAFGRKEKDHV